MISTVEYNGYTFTAEVANLQAFVGAGLPDIRASEEVKSQEDGAIATGYRFGSRTFGWNGHMQDTTAALYLAEREALMGALNMQNQALEGLTMTFNLITGDVRTLREVRIVGANFDYPEGEPSIVWNSYQVTFRATFPFFEGTETDETQQVTDSVFGVVVPAPVPAPLTSSSGASSPTDPLTINNAGNANAYPVFTISAPGTTFTITNNTTGHSMSIDVTLTAGETIIIDTWAKTVMKGSDNIRNLFSGFWLFLKPGNNTITFTVGTGDTADTQLRTVFKNTYIGL